MPDPDAIEQIELREQRATKGPWKTIFDSHLASVNESGNNYGICLCDGAVNQRKSDAEFIAHARSDIPWLLSQLDAALVRVARLEAEIKEGDWRDNKPKVSR